MQAATYSVLKEDADFAVRERTDGQLLACFLNHRDDAAFEILITRYAPMMMAVCQGVLRHRQTAEGAFQQTLLVLMQKAASLRDKQDIGCWLKVAAYHVAQNVKTKEQRRENLEGQCRSCLPAQPLDELVRQEERDNIAAAIQLLPAKLRGPFVLHFVEEMSRSEIARELGLPEGTVASRLAKARKMMRQELMRRGIIP